MAWQLRWWRRGTNDDKDNNNNDNNNNPSNNRTNNANDNNNNNNNNNDNDNNNNNNNSNVNNGVMNAWLPPASYPCGNFFDISSWIFLSLKGSLGHVFTVCIRTENQNQASFSPFGPHEISVFEYNKKVRLVDSWFELNSKWYCSKWNWFKLGRQWINICGILAACSYHSSYLLWVLEFTEM